jgi:predicted NUDIX family phosphoesterase
LEERVLVVDVDCLGELATRNGLLALPLDEIRERVRRFGRFVPRSDAEHDESMRQIIPYAVFKNGNEHLLMKRTKKQGEARLHDMYSIGVGVTSIHKTERIPGRHLRMASNGRSEKKSRWKFTQLNTWES